MARLFDDDEKERQRQALSALGSEAGGGGAASSSAGTSTGMGGGTSSQPGTGVVNWDTYLVLNRGAGEQMGQGLVNNISQQGMGVVSGLEGLTAQGMAGGAKAKTLQDVNPGVYGNLQQQASDVGAKARAAGGEGLGTVLREQYAPGQAYSGGQQAFDAFLTGATTGNELRGLAGTYGRLGEAFTGAEQNYAKAEGQAGNVPGPLPGLPGAETAGEDDLRKKRRQIGVDVRTNPTGRG